MRAALCTVAYIARSNVKKTETMKMLLNVSANYWSDRVLITAKDLASASGPFVECLMASAAELRAAFAMA